MEHGHAPGGRRQRRHACRPEEDKAQIRQIVNSAIACEYERLFVYCLGKHMIPTLTLTDVRVE